MRASVDDCVCVRVLHACMCVYFLTDDVPFPFSTVYYPPYSLLFLALYPSPSLSFVNFVHCSPVALHLTLCPFSYIPPPLAFLLKPMQMRIFLRLTLHVAMDINKCRRIPTLRHVLVWVWMPVWASSQY